MLAATVTGAGKIKHVVYIVQENRSFNDLFNGYPGAYTVSKGRDSKGDTIELRPVSLRAKYIIDHSAESMFAACDGRGKLPGTKCRMDGFDKEPFYGGPGKHPMYAYVPQNDTKPYFAMAHEWVLADRMFQSHLDDSFVSHQYVDRGAGAIERRSAEGTMGLRAGAERHRRDDHGAANDRQPRSAVLRLRDARRRARRCGTAVAFLLELVRDPVERSRRDLVGVPGGQAHLRGAGLEDGRRYPAETVPQGRSRRASSRASRGSRRSVGTRITPTAAADTVRRGSRRSSTRSARASSGTRPRSSYSGTIGAASTIRFRLRTKTMTASVFGFRCSSSHRTPRKTTSRTFATRRRACCALRKISSD